MKRFKLFSIAVLSSALILACSKQEETTQTQAPQQTQETQTAQQPTQQAAQPQPAQQESKPQNQPEQKQEVAKKEEAKKETTVAKVDGESIFKSKSCTACHQAAADTVGPALSKIAAAYKGNKDGLIKFFSGEGKAIVDPAKEAIMKPQIEITKKLSKEEKEALADYILKH
ncbi:MAG: cytochrome C [Sulfurihydrogenibium sp.]|nr:MAG: cytochrome C [Sulfurihydrogenibium sp.]